MEDDKKLNAARVGNALFYIVLALVVAGTLIWRLTNTQVGPAQIAGFSGFVVLTESMEPEIPRGSVVVARQIDPYEIEVGDNITFFVGENTTVTHKVIEVSGDKELEFRTQGVNNSRADTEPVYPSDIVGRVVYHSLFIGNAMEYFAAKPWLFVLLALMIAAVVLLLRYAFRPKLRSVLDDAIEGRR
ncbi:MAG: signal peptidase I [Oscillospiraceae bacterium]|jgi:signal peptidase|nr:signal peptidase I [Oscillospiraceae bacterium]